MNIIQTAIEGILIIEPTVFKDNRGFFMETYHQKRFHDCDIHHVFVQDNLSCSVQNTLRGLHYQIKHSQAKIVHAISGQIFDVAVDIRTDSSTFGKWTGVYLSDQNMRQLFIPEGFAHGFCVLSKIALVSYKCSDFYNPDDEGGILWSDPNIEINWPIKDPIISEKDKTYPQLFELLPEQLPRPKNGR